VKTSPLSLLLPLWMVLHGVVLVFVSIGAYDFYWWHALLDGLAFILAGGYVIWSLCND
jgi:hypothetical protein